MRHLIWILPFLCGLSLLSAVPAAADPPGFANTVSACGTPNNTPVVGNNYPVTQDTTGKLCTSGSGGGGGSNVVITGPLGTQTLAASVAVTDPSLQSGGAALAAIEAPLAAQSSHNVLIGAIEGNGTAGTADTHVVTVQGVASGVAIPVSGTFYQTTQPVSGTVTVSGQADPCFASTKSYADFESTSSGGSIVTLASGKKTYVCSVSVITSAAANVSIIEGTGSSVCTGGTVSGDFLNTGSTAANGAAFAANGGIQAGTGGETIFANATVAQNTCVLFTTTNSPQVNVHISYVQQ